jgi:hypothetical protein
MITDRHTQTAILTRTLAELAEGRLPERIRLEQAARVIVTARRAADLAAEGALALPVAALPAVRAVTEVARCWDSAAVTAFEYAESLPVATIDRLLRAAPEWAAAFTRGPDRLAA